MTDTTLVQPLRADAAEERTLYDGVAVLERHERRRWTLTGPQATEVLNGLVTNDVARLTAGHGCYAAALTPKGKVIADVRVFARGPGDYLIDTPAAAGDGWAGVLRKYVNPRIARYTEVTADTADVGVAGSDAAKFVAAVMGIDEAVIAALPAHGNVAPPNAVANATVVRTPEIGLDAFDVIVSRDGAAALLESFLEAGAHGLAPETWEVARIANGWPLWGIDMDDNTLAQEANLDRFDAISYNKGCYTGQETVARVHFRGHVNRYLRRVRFAPDAEVPRGAKLVVDDAEKVAGDVRSSAVSTRHGGIGIAMVRREAAGGATVRARWDGANVLMTLID